MLKAELVPNYFRARVRTASGSRETCYIWDLSSKGGRLVAETTRDIPNEFVLYMTEDESIQRCCNSELRIDNNIIFTFCANQSAQMSNAAVVTI